MYLTGKRILVFGVANEESIAWHCALQLKRAGAEVVIAYQMRFKSRVLQALKNVSDELRPDEHVVCDITVQSELERAVRDAADGRTLDGVIHSIAFAPPEAFGKKVTDLEAAEFTRALEVSAWSLLAVTRAALPVLSPTASIITMTYLGSSRVIPGYKMMGVAKAALEACVRELAAEVGARGVRVNAISAGPIRTLSARAVPGFDLMLQRFAQVAPLRSVVDVSDVGNVAAFLASDAARAITGQVIFVDNGFSIMGAAFSSDDETRL